MPLKRRSFTLAVVCSPIAGLANVDEFPSKPIRIVMPLAAGQSGDVILRALAEPMTREYKVPVVITTAAAWIKSAFAVTTPLI